MHNEIPTVRDCETLSCDFNNSWRCHAKTVTVGGLDTPTCKSFKSTAAQNRDTQVLPGVTDCELHMCLRNKNLKCDAYSIKVRMRNDQPCCVSFKNRYK